MAEGTNPADPRGAHPHRGTMPTVSVIIPTHNRTNSLVNYLHDAIESALAQTYSDREIIVVDDGSEDNTQELLKSYGDQIRPLHHNRRCTAASLNLGVSHSRGRYVAFLDDDDRWLPKKLELQVKMLESDPCLGFVCGEASFIDQAGRPVDSPVTSGSGSESFASLFDKNFIPASTGLIRRDLFDQVGGFDESLHNAHDWDLWLRASRIVRFRQIAERLTTCGVHPPHSRHKESDSKVVDRARVIIKAAEAAKLGVWARRAREAREYYLHAIACEQQGQFWTAGRYYRRATRTFPLIGSNHEARPVRPTAASWLLRSLRPYLKAAYFGMLTDQNGPDTDGDIIQVRPEEITLKLVTRLDWYLRAGDTPAGDWDLQTKSFAEVPLYKSIVQHFHDGMPWEDTLIFQTSYAGRFNRGAHGEMVRWTRSLPHLVKRYRRTVDPLFRDMQRNGFVLQFDRKGICITEVPHVHVGRAGEILLGRNGNHRLSIAKVLGLGRFFCRVRARHANWQQTREVVRRYGPEECWSYIDRRFMDHPDLQDLLGRRNKQRAHLP